MNRRGFLKSTASGIFIAAAPAIVDSKQVFRGSGKVWVPDTRLVYGDFVKVREGRLIEVSANVRVAGKMRELKGEYEPGNYSVKLVSTEGHDLSNISVSLSGMS